MNLNEIFARPVDRHIEGVIKADDLVSLRLEIEEYVFTNEISKRLDAFLDAYNDYRGANGAWISGFHGSGKSHLLKMLALLLENRPVAGQPTLEYFLPKCGENALLQGAIRRAVAVPSKSILFNIDQKADTISKSETDAVLAVFVKVFNEICGYYGKQGYIAQFERDLESRGLLFDFKANYQRISGLEWERGREQIILEKENIASAYASTSGSSIEASTGIVDHYRADYKVSIEDFAKMVNNYIQEQVPGFRLNFFVDEVGQYIADNIKLMTNLQTIAESLATICQGRAWVIATAQEDMDKVLGEMTQRESDDFSKIQARFKTRLKLTSANVDEVIQKRLLLKNTAGESFLAGLYRQEKNNFGTLFDFTDGSISYRNYRDEKHFINSYPFIPYQFTLFQSAIENLSLHSAFEGKHSSVGERTMLVDFQQVVISIANQGIGCLATFDQMFEGIRTVLKSQVQRPILTAEQHLDNPFAIQVLKALFLVKYVKAFKATSRNLRVLLYDHFDLDFNALRDKIDEALDLLERQTYIQRNGEQYEFLTDEEKDIEQEIKNTEIDTQELTAILDPSLFTDILRERKIRYEPTGQDFTFAKKLDDHLIGREQELAIHFITPLHDHVADITLLQANSLGRPELLVVLPPDERLVRDLYLYQKTDKYIRQNQSTAQLETVRRILGDKSFQNRERRKILQARLCELVVRARLFAKGSELDITGDDPQSRLVRAFSELIVQVYTNLRMLHNVTYHEEDLPRYLEMSRNTLFGDQPADFSEAEQELLAFIQANQRSGVRTTMKGLEERFTKTSYGWYLAAIQCLLAKLCGRGKVEVRQDGNLLENEALLRALRNTHAFPNLLLEPQIDFTSSQVSRLKNFYNDFFDRPPSNNEARALAKETVEALRLLSTDLEALAAQVNRYPFLSALAEPLQIIHGLLPKPYTFFYTDLPELQERLFDFKETALDPIRSFMSGANRGIYDEVSSFLRLQDANFINLAGDQPVQLRAILSDPACFKGNHMRRAKELMDALKAEIQTCLESERQSALQTLATLQNSLQRMDEYTHLSDAQHLQLGQPFAALRHDLQSHTLIAVIRDSLRRFEEQDFNRLLTQVTTWAQPPAQPPVQPTAGATPVPTVVAEPPVEYLLQNRLTLAFHRPYLATEQDVEEYLAQLREAMLEAIRTGKRIQI